MPKDIFKMKCPECGVDHEKEANQHCLPDRFDWCDDCDTCEPISFKQQERN